MLINSYKAYIELSHFYWKKVITPGSCLIDATCGNGHDTYALAQFLQGHGTIFAYDIQAKAIEKTSNTLATLSEKERSVVTLRHASHSHFLESSAKLIVYNLGYLPSGDKSITTKVNTTLESVKKALHIAEAISLVCYPGHEEGAREEKALLSFLESLPSKNWSVSVHQWINRERAPSLIWIESHP